MSKQPQLAIAAAFAIVVFGARPSSALQTAATSSEASVEQTLKDLQSALADGRSRLDNLTAEIEQQKARLAEVELKLNQMLQPDESQSAMSGTPSLRPAEVEDASTEVVSTTTAAQPGPKPQPDEPVAVPATRFEFYGESKVRYETLQQDFPGCIGCPNRQRGRLRLRFGAEGRLSPDFKAVFGFGVGELNDPNTVYVNLGSNFSRKVATWDRGYVEYHPTKLPWMNLTAGKFPYTWLRSSMTFDVDFYPEGLSERFSFDLKNAGRLKNFGVQGFQLIVNEQPMDRHMTIVGTQLTGKIQTAARVSTLVAATGVAIRRPEFILRALVDGSDVGVRNTNAVVVSNGLASYVGEFRYANVIVENAVRTPWEAIPVVVGLEYQRNLGAVSDRDTALSLRLDGGRAQRRGDWEFGWHMFRVEQDAILAALGESDWRAPSNVVQHRFAVNRMMHANVQLSFTLYRGRTLDRNLPGALLAPNLSATRKDPWTNRVYLDVTYRY